MTQRLRRFAPGDGPLTYALYHNAVHHGTAPHYTPAQQQAWCPSKTMPDTWPGHFERSETWIAEDEHGSAGFLTLNSDGYLNLFFVRPDLRRSGTASRLYDEAVRHASKNALSMSSHASLLARPFFERRGWTVMHREDVPRGGQILTRFFMTAPATE